MIELEWRGWLVFPTVKQRIIKLRKLYSILNLKLETSNGLATGKKHHNCIIETSPTVTFHCLLEDETVLEPTPDIIFFCMSALG